MREDVESAYLDITEFTGQSLTGPRELLTRKVLCSNVQPVSAVGVAAADGAAQRNESNNLTQLNFRIMSTSPGAMLNAKVELVMPLLFHHCIAGDSTQGQSDIQLYYGAAGAVRGDRGWVRAPLAGQIAPRRNGILKACASISSTVNSTVSFTFRPDEGIDVMEQMFTQPGVGGQTGVYSREEAGSWGNTDGGLLGQPPAANLAAAHRYAGAAGIAQVRNWYSGNDGTMSNLKNKGFIERRADFRSGGGAVGGGVSDWRSGAASANNYVKYDYRTTLSVPPFKTFNKDIYCRTPTWIPYADSIDLMLNFKPANEIKAALLQCASIFEGRNSVTVQDYDFGFYAQPYLVVEWCVPPVSLRPSYTLPCWRNQSYSQQVAFPAGADARQVSFQGIRLDSMPSLISVHVQDGAIFRKLDRTNTLWQRTGYQWTEYFGKISEFSLSVNERSSILSDKSDYDFYKLYRMYAPDSKMTYLTWSKLRQVILLRSDVLTLEKGQSVFNPTNLSINMKVNKAIQHTGVIADQEVRLTFWYFNDAITLSQQAAAVTSMLLSPSDVQQLRVTPEAKEIQTLMEMGLQS